MEQIKEKQQNHIQILTTLDQNYLPRLQVLLTSVYLNNPGEQADIWLMHSRIPAEALEPVSKLCRLFGFGFSAVQIDGSSFQGAPVSRQYPKEMYYRLLASQFLPEDLHRIIYLDPDILVINSLRPLWDMDMEGNLFAAASHTGMTELANNINQIRLARNAGIHEVIQALPQGYQTVVSRDDAYLSGGEKQRLAIARVFLKDAPIIILDEATAYADAENEAKIQAAFAKLAQNKTVLMIAHRLKTVERADQILVMDKGKLVGTGTHEELLTGCETYKRLVDANLRRDRWSIGKGAM